MWNDFFPSSSPLNAVFDSLPPARYKDTVTTILSWIQQSETKVSVPPVAVAEYEIMEQRLLELKVSVQTVERMSQMKNSEDQSPVDESTEAYGSWVIYIS